MMEHQYPFLRIIIIEEKAPSQASIPYKPTTAKLNSIPRVQVYTHAHTYTKPTYNQRNKKHKLPLSVRKNLADETTTDVAGSTLIASFLLQQEK